MSARCLQVSKTQTGTVLSGFGKYAFYCHYLEDVPVEFAQKRLDRIRGKITNVCDAAYHIESCGKKRTKQKPSAELNLIDAHNAT